MILHQLIREWEQWIASVSSIMSNKGHGGASDEIASQRLSPSKPHADTTSRNIELRIQMNCRFWFTDGRVDVLVRKVLKSSCKCVLLLFGWIIAGKSTPANCRWNKLFTWLSFSSVCQSLSFITECLRWTATGASKPLSSGLVHYNLGKRKESFSFYSDKSWDSNPLQLCYF